MEPAKKLIIIEDFKPPKPNPIRVKVGKDRFPYRVDDDGRVIPNPRIIADMSECQRPFEDRDALNCHLPFNRDNARLEVHDQLATPPTAKRLAEHTRIKIKRLPNPTKDAPAYLRECVVDADKRLDSCEFGRDAVNHTRRSLAAYIEECINEPIFQDGPTCWAEFLGEMEPLIQEHRKAINLWIYIRWLQRMISHYERIATATSQLLRNSSHRPPPAITSPYLNSAH